MRNKIILNILYKEAIFSMENSLYKYIGKLEDLQL